MIDDQLSEQKRQAAEAASALVTDGMVVGLGTGSTAFYAIAALIRRVGEGLRITAIPTSERSAAQAREGGIILSDFSKSPIIDLTIDGADAIDRRSLDLIKGLGGALLREKIVAAASRRFVIVADGTKLVDRLGTSTPIPVEVVSFGWEATAGQIVQLGAQVALRRDVHGEVFRTDGGNLILDCHLHDVEAPAELDLRLQSIVGVVETGLFIGRTSEVFIASSLGVERLAP